MDGVIQLRAFVENLLNLDCDGDAFSSVKHAFKNVVVTGTGFYHGSRADLRQLCGKVGLRFLGDLRRYDTTVLVLPLSRKDAKMFGVGSQWRSEKVEKAFIWKIPVVSVDWLLEGLAKGAPLPPEKFDPYQIANDDDGSVIGSEEKDNKEKRDLEYNNGKENQAVDNDVINEEECVAAALQEFSIRRPNDGDLQNKAKDGDLSVSGTNEDATRWDEEDWTTGACSPTQESHEALNVMMRGMAPESQGNEPQVIDAASFRSHALEDEKMDSYNFESRGNCSERHHPPVSRMENSPMHSCSGFSADDNLPWTQLEQAHLASSDFEETAYSNHQSLDNESEPLQDVNHRDFTVHIPANPGPKPRCRAVLRIPLDSQESAPPKCAESKAESPPETSLHFNSNEDPFVPVKLLSKPPRGNQVKRRHSLKSLQNLVVFAEQIQCRNPMRITLSIKDKNLAVVLRPAAHTTVRAKIVSFYRLLGEEWQVEFRQFLTYDQVQERLASAQPDVERDEQMKDIRKKIGDITCEGELFVSQKVDACSLRCLETVFNVQHIRKTSSAPLSVKPSASEKHPAFFCRFELDSDMKLV
eukprot:jgi/Picsp_1/963/NSC_04447-R1_---NA---